MLTTQQYVQLMVTDVSPFLFRSSNPKIQSTMRDNSSNKIYPV